MYLFAGASSEAACPAVPEKGPARRRDLIELLVGYGFLVAVVWTQGPLQKLFYFGTIAWFIASIVYSFPGWRAMGCSVAGFWRSLWIVLLAAALGGVATIVATNFHTLHHPGRPILWVRAFGGYTVWALTQQFLMQGYFLLRLLRIMPSKTWAVITAGTVFALIHLPNPVLTPATLLWGVVACLLFVKFRNVYTLALAHAIFGICVTITVPATAHHNMRVGIGYLTYTAPRNIHLSQIDQNVSTDAWHNAEAPMRRSARQALP
jgi:hypothetical protein